MLVALNTFESAIAGEMKHEIESIMLELEKSSEGGYAHLILSNGQRCFRASTLASRDANGETLNVGCIAKLVAASTLLHVLSSDGQLDTSLCDLLKIQCQDWRSEITVRHLLNHNHGLDEPAEWRRPLLHNGFTDVAAIFQGVAEEPLAPVGRRFSYSNVGSWLVAAVVEAVSGQRYTEAVRSAFPNLLEDKKERLELCPATGRGAPVNAHRLLEAAMSVGINCLSEGHGNGGFSTLQTRIHEGWHPAEIGVCLGWKAYRNGWYGYKSAPRGAQDITLRVCPSKGIGFLTWSRGVPTWQFIRQVFADDMVETPGRAAGVKMVQAPGAPRDRPTFGTFQRMDSTIEIVPEQMGAGLVARTRMKDAKRNRTYDARLRRVHNGLFMVVPAISALNLSVVQFMRDEAGEVSHLWNTGRIWRKRID